MNKEELSWMNIAGLVLNGILGVVLVVLVNNAHTTASHYQTKEKEMEDGWRLAIKRVETLQRSEVRTLNRLREVLSIQDRPEGYEQVDWEVGK